MIDYKPFQTHWKIKVFKQKSSPVINQKRLISLIKQDSDPLYKENSRSDENNLKNNLSVGKASISFVLAFSFVIFPIAQADNQLEQLSSKSDANSQNLKILKPTMSPRLGGPTGGGEILIEDNALLASASPLENSDKPKITASGADEISVYVVREGDTISQIAEMFDVKSSTIRGFNNIRKDSDLKVGDELLILPVDGLLHKVEKGDTLASVAKKYNSDEMDVALFNDIPEDGKLTVGDDIIIPNGELPAPTPVKTTAKKVASNSSVKTKDSSTSTAGFDSYPAGFYTHPIPRGSVKSQGFHGPYQAQDLAAAIGTSVVASSAGKVIAVRYGWSGGYGNMIIINDGKANVLYAHLSEINVTQGQNVSQGELIGKVGSTGRSTGSHLHIEYRGNKGPMKTPVW